MGIPKEHEHATFGTFKAPTYLYEDAREQVRDWANTWHNKLETAHSLILCGPTGTGKSHLAASAMKRMSAHRGLAPKWIGFARLLDILGTFDREYDAVSDYGKGINCLCIDDMGETSITDGKGKLSRAGERFVIVLRARMEDLLPTIITTNLTSYHGQTSVARFFGSDDRVTSRMSRAYHWIDINLPDWRVR